MVTDYWLQRPHRRVAFLCEWRERNGRRGQEFVVARMKDVEGGGNGRELA